MDTDQIIHGQGGQTILSREKIEYWRKRAVEKVDQASRAPSVIFSEFMEMVQFSGLYDDAVAKAYRKIQDGFGDLKKAVLAAK